jgi:glucose-6-phosphate isomerase
MKDYYSEQLADYESTVAECLEKLSEHHIIPRIWSHDHSVWKDKPDEIANRLGWLRIAKAMVIQRPEIESFVDEVRGAGFKSALLLGMGGSSLAPEVFRNVFGVRDGFLELEVLDSTHPDAVRAVQERHDPASTLYIVATKSGGTAETISFFKYFFNQALNSLGSDIVGNHFIAITDPNSGLMKLAKKHHFRKIFQNDPNLGGRYSALSMFGLMPAALIGVELEKLLNRTLDMMHNGQVIEGQNLGADCGATLAGLAANGRDKLTLIGASKMHHIGPWVEQLVAESLGKEDKGILPIGDESLGNAKVYDDDRFFVEISMQNESSQDNVMNELTSAGHPTARVVLKDEYDLGAEFFRWELATAVTAHFLQVNPFDQPNVEAAKVKAKGMIKAFQDEGELPALSPILSEDGIAAFSNLADDSLDELLSTFFSQTQKGNYIALQAYLPPSDSVTDALQRWRIQLRDKTKAATTLGYGPRFLHSTGQLHKGDAGNGLFVQLTCEPIKDMEIPDEADQSDSSISFGTLIAAQALGDRQALIDAGRRVIWLDLGSDINGGIERLIQWANQWT